MKQTELIDKLADLFRRTKEAADADVHLAVMAFAKTIGNEYRAQQGAQPKDTTK